MENINANPVDARWTRARVRTICVRIAYLVRQNSSAAEMLDRMIRSTDYKQMEMEEFLK